jgi:hypothetical protein
VKNANINRDEVRRQLREADTEQRSSIVGFRDTLQRIFGSDDIPAAAKAEVLGVPHRRQFLKIGGTTIIGAAVLAACGGNDNPPGAGETGVTTASTSSTTAPPNTGESKDADIVLLRTAASLENLAVTTYAIVLGDSSTKLPTEINFDPAVVDAATLFRDHHRAHADALNAVLTGDGEQAYTKPNDYLMKNVVTPALSGLVSQDAVVRFARNLENIAAGTYAYAAGVLSTPSLRTTIMSIGGVESRHASALALVLDATGKTAVPQAFTDSGPEGRVPDEALLEKNA